MSEKTGHLGPDDHAQRFEPLLDGHGRRAIVQQGSDQETDVDDDHADPGVLEVCSTRNYREHINEDEDDEERSERTHPFFFR